MTTITESDVGRASLDWLSDLGWQTVHGPDIAPDTPGAQRDALLPKLVSGVVVVGSLKQ